MEKVSPFKYVDSILKGPKIDQTDDYNPFMVNRGLSFYQDTILWANEMNRLFHLDKDMQYEFLNSVVSKKKRPFAKWVGKDKSDPDIEMIMSYYGLNRQRAIEAMMLLNKDEIEMIRERTYEGGRQCYMKPKAGP